LIANTAGWFTAELGRQPWIVYGLLPTVRGSSPSLSSGNILFTLIGFMGIYLLLGILYAVLVCYEVGHGPSALVVHPSTSAQGSAHTDESSVDNLKW
jgi:cytochrome d ubiquinol oxidase subunit I